MPPPSRDIGSHDRKSRQQIVQLREFDLQLSFTGSSAPGEDVEDKLCAVHNLTLERCFQVALLRGRQIPIKDNSVDPKAFM